MRSRSAFTLIEVMIVMVIIGLLAAMAIPAFIKVHNASIVKAVESGKSVTREKRERYNELKRDGKLRQFARPVVVVSEATPPTATPFQRIEIAGLHYYLIPKQDAKETEIAGRTFWLIPEITP